MDNGKWREERVTPIAAALSPQRKMENPNGVTHAIPQLVERQVLSVTYRDGMEVSEEIRILPNTRKSIK